MCSSEDPASYAPVSMPISSSMRLQMTFSDGTARDFSTDRRAVFSIVTVSLQDSNPLCNHLCLVCVACTSPLRGVTCDSHMNPTTGVSGLNIWTLVPQHLVAATSSCRPHHSIVHIAPPCSCCLVRLDCMLGVSCTTVTLPLCYRAPTTVQ